MGNERGATCKRVLVLGLGNPLVGDDAFGLEVAARLARDYEVTQAAEVVQAGTDILAWVDEFSHYEEVILIDAVLDPERVGKTITFTEADLAAWPHDIPSCHAVSPLAAWRLFRTLSPDSRTRLWLVGYCTALIAPGHHSYSERHVKDACAWVHEACRVATKRFAP